MIASLVNVEPLIKAIKISTDPKTSCAAARVVVDSDTYIVVVMTPTTYARFESERSVDPRSASW